jgi:hypothetical protein
MAANSVPRVEADASGARLRTALRTLGRSANRR